MVLSDGRVFDLNDQGRLEEDQRMLAFFDSLVQVRGTLWYFWLCAYDGCFLRNALIGVCCDVADVLRIGGIKGAVSQNVPPPGDRTTIECSGVCHFGMVVKAHCMIRLEPT